MEATTDVYDGPGYAVGRFVCPPESRLWGQDNRIKMGPIFVFPSRAVEIEQVGRRPVVADRNQVIFYNHRQIYRRSLLDREGDRCVFFWVEPPEVAQILRDVGLPASDDPVSPFGFSHGPGHPAAFLRHLTLARYVFRTPERDHLFVQESLLWLLRDVAGRCAALMGRVATGDFSPARSQRKMDDRVREVQRILALRYPDNLSLAELGERVETSPFHLAREFRRRTGASIHAYRNRLRLLHALDRMEDPAARLVDIALDAGFSSHSHFSLAFRQMFGRAPSEVRAGVLEEGIDLSSEPSSCEPRGIGPNPSEGREGRDSPSPNHR